MAASPHNSTGPPDQQHQDDGTLTDCTADSTQQPEDEFYNNDEHPEDVLYDETEENPPYCGHAPGPVPSHCFRAGSGNIANLPLYKGEPGNDNLFQAVINFEIDLLMIQETGVNWLVLKCREISVPTTLE